MDFRNAELVTRMGSERIVRHELVGDLERERGIETSLDVDPRQFRTFELDVRRQFLSLERQVRFLRV
jgi:hypothetical protein